ncbi:MAG: hypothetical protein JSW28_00600 [Thermoplasmata archaeon]|nr:MAG: hypothetical protein JSW28_00600 [Thermoplasmata archaeon]
MELYKSLGYEVHLEAATREDMEECGVCFEEMTDRYKTIYTRKREE